ncbi:AAA family ATPase [Polaribacter sp. BAL334]|uniref:ATP-binding protein n=1 Tax=Polaribacter sp. BAL334 TaxID=1708178 RepID=UPI0018D23446|nr:AAA family ATPase [Polaribacter sp. BAL334]MBG7613194.1 AAA family ATPase [Polaribacter sp. BAL334]
MATVITLKLQVLKNIGAVYTKAKNTELNISLFKGANKELSFLAEYFHISKQQALFLSIIYVLNYKGRRVTLMDLNSYFECNPMKLLEYSDDFIQLYEKRLLLKKNNNYKHSYLKLKGVDEEFFVNEIITEKILKSEPIPDVLICIQKHEDIFSLVENLYNLADQRDDHEISTKELFEQTHRILEENNHLPFIEKINFLGISLEDKYLFLFVLWKFFDGDGDPSVERTFKLIYEKHNVCFLKIQKVLNKENKLIQEGWLETDDENFFNDVNMKLTEKAFDLLNECGINLYNKDSKHKNHDTIIKPSTIPFRNLIFSDDEAHQLKLLKTLLMEDNFKNTQERLIQKALPKGVTVLLHGAPGTGKTESVLQIAKATNRDIMKIDISASRSAWFGESEKIMKNVFQEYQSYVKNQTLIPILFFNEADAILSKRKEGFISNVSDTENRIQNILLEEIENFEGILIATSNLTKNMDSAFERRFLFKIEFQKPNIAAKSQIWKSKLPNLSIDDCDLLASLFDFSGGQIDNIVRKNEINEIIYGNSVDVKTLLEYCKEETLNHQYSKTLIGFKNGY